MEEFLKYLADSLYTPLATILVAIWGFIISLRNSKGILKIFTFYFLGFVILQGSYFFAERNIKHNPFLSHILDFGFTIFEFLIFVRFFWEIFSKRIKRFLVVLSLYFLTTCIYYFVKDFNKVRALTISSLETVFIIESISLLIPCVIYYVKMFKLKEPEPLQKDKYFWITTGLCFFILSTLPFSYLMNYLRVEQWEVYKYLYSIVYLFYCLLFIMIVKAILCKPVLAK
jgi:hypothetical protein